MFRRFNVKTRGWPGICLCLSLLFLGACEAKLDLSGVEAEKQRTTTRYDQFLAAAANERVSVVVGMRGVVLTSSDAGYSWQRHIISSTTAVRHPALIDVEVCPDRTFIALDADRKIWSSDATGATWTPVTIETTEEVVDLACDPAGNYWVVGSFSLILKSADRGATWQDLSIGEDAMFSRIQFLSSQDAVITGEFGVVYVTTDSGQSWVSRGPVPGEFYSAASHFRTPEEGWVGGLQGVVFHTSDGGRNWSRQATDTLSPLYNFLEVQQSLYALGDQGTILKYADGHWQKMNAPGLGFGYLRAGLPVGPEQFVVAGGNGLIRRVP
ncbi:WD40/YVTN/BNR-like repeat-containing protein [Luteithermobacter gelatinilyticus]|uniref:WD40/YVTN/BNR-like repeat-containing protein n=1 Tax=Luteithermobacter gelatinilyticus TaxID=2582913 RepID=UPI001105C87D|nr:YCF48-related protein [Luteithermobacter gelatinilyticus]